MKKFILEKTHREYNNIDQEYTILETVDENILAHCEFALTTLNQLTSAYFENEIKIVFVDSETNKIGYGRMGLWPTVIVMINVEAAKAASKEYNCSLLTTICITIYYSYLMSFLDKSQGYNAIDKDNFAKTWAKYIHLQNAIPDQMKKFIEETIIK